MSHRMDEIKPVHYVTEEKMPGDDRCCYPETQS